MRLVSGTKRILDAKQSITPRLVERCLGLDLGSLSSRIGEEQVWARSASIPGCKGSFDILCAVPGIADRYTPYLQIFPSRTSTSNIEAEQLIADLKSHYGYTRMRISPTGRGGWIQYRSPHHSDRTVMYLFDFAKRDPNRKAFSGILLANVHRR